jgi:transposase-like protein
VQRDAILDEAFRPRLAVTQIADAIGISRSAVSQWRRVPERHLAAVARITKIPKYRLRPDLCRERAP